MSKEKVYYHVKEIGDLLESSDMVHIGMPDGKKYYHLPFWFEERKGGGYFVHDRNNLPAVLESYIAEDIYIALAKHLGLKETSVNNLWLDEDDNEYILGRFGFKRKL